MNFALRFYISLVLCLCFASNGAANLQLDYDTEKNGVDLYGPYLKYNFLRPPFSFGLSRFRKKDLNLTPNPKGGGLRIQWPAYFLNHGDLSLYDLQSKEIASTKFKVEDLVSKEGSFFFNWLDQIPELAKRLEEGVHFCLREDQSDFQIEICSDKIKVVAGRPKPLREGNDVVVRVNGVITPKNAQANIPPEQKNIELNVKFRSGLKIWINEKIYRVDKKQVVVHPESQKILIRHPELERRKLRNTLLHKVQKAFTVSSNYLQNKNDVTFQTHNIKMEDMEFSPFREGRSLQLFAIGFENIPEPQARPSLSSDSPEGSYFNKTELIGTLPQGAKAVGTSGSRIQNLLGQGQFQWDFRTPSVGKWNRDWVGIQKSKDQPPRYYFAEIYRATPGSVSLQGVFSSGLDFDLVPGAGISADYWTERWGLAFRHARSLSTFKSPENGSPLSQNTTSLDLLMRWSRGVRPLHKSFGLGLRYFQPEILGDTRGDIAPQLLGGGVFWQSAPLGVLNGSLNLIPFFQRPKWMELSAFYYPVALSAGFDLGAAYSVHGRLRLLFSTRWFLSTSFNFYSLTFNQKAFGGVTSVADGSIGLGLNF